MINYNESVDGDISNSPDSPLPLTLAEGSNTISATTGGGEQEYVTLTVPEGLQLDSVVLESYSPIGDVAFIGVQQGDVFTEPLDNSANTANLLGYVLFGDAGQVGTDILDNIGDASDAIGFDGALASGNYTFALQQLGANSDYTLAFNVSEVTEEPEPTGEPAVVSFEVVPINFSEEADNNLVEWIFTVEGDFPEDGLTVNLTTDGGGFPFAFLDQFAASPEAEFVNADLVGFDESGGLNIALSEPEASFRLFFANDILEEGTQTFNFNLVEGEGYLVDPDQNANEFTISDDNGGPGVGPTVSLSVSETDLAEGDPITVNFELDGEIPAEGVQLLVQGSVPGALGQFDISDLSTLELVGIDGLPEVGDAGGGSFLVTVTEPTASITTSIFNDIIAEEPLEIDFTLANGEVYEVAPDAGSVTLTISDEEQPAGPTVSLTVDNTDVFEGDVITLTFDVEGEIPADGVMVLVNDVESAQNQLRSLTEFDIASIELAGISGFPLPAEGDSGFFVTLAEPTATITLPIFDDGADEDETTEIFNFELIDGEAYEVNPDAAGATISITDVGDTPLSELPVVSITTTTPVVSEDSDNPVLDFTFTVEGEIPEGEQGLPIVIGGDIGPLFLEPGILDGNFPFVIEPEDGIVPIEFGETEFTVGLTGPSVTISLTVFDDIIEEEPRVFDLAILEGEGYVIDQDTASITLEDGPSVTPGSGPTVNLSVSETDLEEGDELIVNFDVVGEIPDGGVEVFLAGGPTALGEFNIFNEDGSPAIELVGIDEFPVQGGDDGGFFVTLNENQASITLSVFEDGPGEGEEVLNFELVDGELYEVDEANSTVDLTINDTPEGTPIIGITLDRTEVSEEDEVPVINATFTVTNAEVPTPEFDADGNLISGGLSFLFDTSALATLSEELVGGNPGIDPETLAFGSFFDPEQPFLFEFILLDETSSGTLTILNDVIEEEPEEYTFTILPNDAGLIDSNYVINPDATAVTFTVTDGNGGPGVGPTVGITVTDDELVEGDTVTLDFAVDGEIPAEGLEVLVQSPTPGTIGEFSIFDDQGNFLIETTGLADFPIAADGQGSSFLATITEPDASITLSVFDDGPGEGLEELSFAITNGEEYEVAADAGSVSFTIDDGNILDTPFTRFQNSSIPGTYVYAAGAEADSIRANQPGFIEEGVAFSAAIAPNDELIALNRLESNQLPGTFLYVGDEELASINADPNFSSAFTDQGVAFYAYGAGAGEETPFNRFQNTDVPGTYLFATGAEADSIRANFPNFIDEGVAFEALI